jgi:high-affinity iron transporter
VGATFVITLREGFEAALLLGIVYAYLEKIGRRQQYGYVTWGAALGVLASVAAGIAVSFLSGPLLDLGPDLIAAVVIFTAVGVLTWHGWWMRQHARAISTDVERRIEQAEASRRLWLVGLIAFAGVFREGAETVLFIWGLVAQASSLSGWAGLFGGAAGVATAATLGWLVFHGGRRISLRRFFSVTSVLILLLAAGMVSAGVGKLQALGLLPRTDVLWDTSWLVSEHGGVGGFLSGLLGYRAQPSTLEVAAYAAYLLGAGLLLFGPTATPTRPAHPDEPGGAPPPSRIVAR